ncbi:MULTISPECIES: hypothetical protein [unclassified Mammaliicoccus]|uniref:hypothetical protein n=1 Tax=unclassified Mammaliicoccus TaxID=2803851 RepID=UPI001EFA8866|nr:MULTISPECIES: hypothetical protein [unclassified Mammaliicoccus]
MRNINKNQIFNIELDNIENLLAYESELSCWLHCLRDVLYYEGIHNVTKYYVQPLNFVMEYNESELISIYGGVDTNYYTPEFNNNLYVERKKYNEDSWSEIIKFFKAGRLPIVDLDWKKIKYSKFYKYPESPLHSTIILDIDYNENMILVADTHLKKNKVIKSFNNKAWVEKSEFLKGLNHKSSWLYYTLDLKENNKLDITKILKQTCFNLKNSTNKNSGICGINSFKNFFANLEEPYCKQVHKNFLLYKCALQLKRHIISDHNVLLRYLELYYFNETKIIQKCLKKIIQQWRQIVLYINFIVECENLNFKYNIVDSLNKIVEMERQLVMIIESEYGVI